jgi:hypothetical protein
LSFKMAGISGFFAATTRFCTTTPLLGSHLYLGRAGCIIYVPRHLLFVAAGMNFFLLSGRLGVGAMKGMSEVRRAE